MIVEVDPEELVAVIVYVVWAAAAVGVPEMTPVELLRLSPAGSAGLIAYEVTVPVTVGADVEIA